MKYPFVKQKGIKDCGPACTLMILKYYGGYVSLDRLSEVLNTDKNGTTAYHIIKALRSFGFNCDGYRYDDFSFNFPCIAHVKTNSYNHYVVIWKVNKDYVIIGDPYKGNIKISKDDFIVNWTGVIIYMTPYKEIVHEEKVNIFKFLYNNIRMKSLVFAGIISIIVVLLSIVLSFFSNVFINYRNTNIIEYIILLFVFLAIISSLLNYFRNSFLYSFGNDIDYRLSMNTFSSILSLPYKSHRNKTTGEIVSYFNDLSLIKDFILKLVISLFLDIPLIVIITFYFLHVSFLLFIINVCFILVFLILFYLYKNKINYYSSEVLRKKSLVNSFITECCFGFETISNLNVKDKITGKFKTKYHDYKNYIYKYGKIRCSSLLYKDIISNLYIILLLLNMHSINISIYALASLFISSIHNLLEFDFEMSDVASSIEHIHYLYSKNSNSSIATSPFIMVDHLSFSYDGVNNVLNDICLKIKDGEKIFVSGKSGSGKSTLFKIIKGYYDEYDGKASVGGNDCFKYNFKNIFYVSTLETIFTGTVLENLEITGLKYQDDLCEISNFIINYDYLLEENGYNLSSGQRQRICLGRVIDFDILIIDEGLSDVDINMERRILKKIINKYHYKTIIFISHRMDNLDLFDRFIEMSSGRILNDVVRVKG